MKSRISHTIELSSDELLDLIKHGCITDGNIAIVMKEVEYLNAVKQIELS